MKYANAGSKSRQHKAVPKASNKERLFKNAKLKRQYAKLLKQEGMDASKLKVEPEEQTSDRDVDTASSKTDEPKKSAKPNPFAAALAEANRIREERTRVAEEKQQNFEQNRKAKEEYYKKRDVSRQALRKRTSKGQPVMKHQLDVLLDKLKNLTAVGAGRRRYVTAAHRTLYDVLGLLPSADKRAIKAQYYKLSLQYHPDHNTSADASVKFQAISDAYSTLGNDIKRREYDRQYLHHHTGTLRRSSPFRSATTFTPNRRSTFERRYPGGASYAGSASANGDFNYDEHARQHYGDTSAEGAGTGPTHGRERGHLRQSERDHRKQQHEYQEWRSRFHAGQQESWNFVTMTVGLTIVGCAFAFYR
ncbi:hypothetical protein RI367_005130 [Sorochytrium milnesiophthora]